MRNRALKSFVYLNLILTAGYDVPKLDLHDGGLERHHVCHRARLYHLRIAALRRQRDRG